MTTDPHEELDDLTVWYAALAGLCGPETSELCADTERKINAGELDPSARITAVQYMRSVRPDLHARALDAAEAAET